MSIPEGWLCRSRMSDRQTQRGFTLIEMAMVLLISGLLLAGLAQGFKVWLQWRAQTVTTEAQKEIKDALRAFVVENRRLPCPAPLDAPPETANFGSEVTTTCADGTAYGGTVLTASATGDVRIGAVPTRTLNIPDKLAFDGWNQRFTYAVSAGLADSTVGYRSGNGTIDLVDGNGNSVVTPPATGEVVIISHGRAGNGAYSRYGVAATCDTGSLDGENCDGDAQLRVAEYASAAGAAQFDNIADYNLVDDDSLAYKMLICSEKGMLYMPDDPAADADGCVLDVGKVVACNAKGMLYNPDDPAADTDGCVFQLGRVAVCNAQKAFYAPGDAAADANGCVGGGPGTGTGGTGEPGEPPCACPGQNVSVEIAHTEYLPYSVCNQTHTLNYTLFNTGGELIRSVWKCTSSGWTNLYSYAH